MIGYDYYGYLIFAFVTSLTPGPNNYLLLAHGKKYGFKGSIKLLAGIFLGFFILLMMTGYGVVGLIQKNNFIYLTLKIISSIWLLYLAVALSAFNINPNRSDKQKLNFVQIFFMQFANPKAWIMAFGGASAFMPKLGDKHLSVLVFSTTFAVIGIPCMILWISFGETISRFVKTKKTNTVFGLILFVLMVLSIISIWI